MLARPLSPSTALRDALAPGGVTAARRTAWRGPLRRCVPTPSLALNGVGPRLLFGSLLVSLQFVLFTECRDLLGVSRDDLTFYWDALSVLR